MSEEHLRDCPFCGRGDHLTVGRVTIGHGDSAKSVHCQCGASMVSSGWDENAVEKWNERKGPGRAR